MSADGAAGAASADGAAGAASVDGSVAAAGAADPEVDAAVDDDVVDPADDVFDPAVEAAFAAGAGADAGSAVDDASSVVFVSAVSPAYDVNVCGTKLYCSITANARNIARNTLRFFTIFSYLLKSFSSKCLLFKTHFRILRISAKASQCPSLI